MYSITILGLMHPYLKAVSKRVVIGDGAFGTYIQSLNLGADDFGGSHLEGCNENLCLTRPELIRGMHEKFLEAGCDFITTATFGAFAVPLAEYGLEDKTREINLAGAQIARQAADELGEQRWVAGSIGPGTKSPTLGQITYDELKAAYFVQAKALIEGGVDFLLIETAFDLLAAKACIAGCRQAATDLGKAAEDVPIQAQITIEQTGRMLLGTETGAALTSLEPLSPDVIGLNCATGPAEMGEHLRVLAAASPMPISCIPNAGLPRVEDGQTVYDLSPDELAEHLARYITELGISVVGGCCGTTPAHLKAVIEKCAGLTPKKRSPVLEPAVASIYSAVPVSQDTSFLIIGERANATGSKKFSRALEADDLDTCIAIGIDQQAEGAHVLDMNVDYVGRNGVEDMAQLAKRAAQEISIPIALDSSQPEVLEAGLKWMGGRAILNSANLEDGDGEGSRADLVFKMAKEFGAAVICILIDEEGQARDLEWKLRITRRLHKMATEKYGLRPQDLIFDALVFPLTTGDEDLKNDGIATIQAIQQIKAELPGVYTSLGISNVSFGIKPGARAVLNSVFLDECLKAGLDAAIVHAGNIMPLNQIEPEQLETARDLIWNRGDNPLLHLLEICDDDGSGGRGAGQKKPKDDIKNLPIEKRLARRIVDGNKAGLEPDLDEALNAGHGALNIVNDFLLKGMKEVGELFGAGKMQLPFVLKSAETMKAAVSYLEPFMEKADAAGKAQIVLATVQGDVHDIGKNLVDIILTNNGFTVHNLGIKVPINEMIEKAQETGADAIGMSGLLVKSTLIMGDNLKEMNQRGVSHIPVLLGGAALKRSYVEKDLQAVYEGEVFYGKDAFETLSIMEKLAD